MEKGRVIIAGVCFSIAGLGAMGQPVIVRPGACAAQDSYLLARNSGAIININLTDPQQGENDVIVFRQHGLDGWASQRLLTRFDLRLEENGPTFRNSGVFCRGTQ
ncbi:hypothetical protein [Hyphococcus sp. DH-69]|uniref:hypothetical protein n=1 Tax=Hyphococcus formosus TaxID=3143534 RepID=UPI00398B2D74